MWAVGRLSLLSRARAGLAPTRPAPAEARARLPATSVSPSEDTKLANHPVSAAPAAAAHALPAPSEAAVASVASVIAPTIQPTAATTPQPVASPPPRADSEPASLAHALPGPATGPENVATKATPSVSEIAPDGRTELKAAKIGFFERIVRRVGRMIRSIFG